MVTVVVTFNTMDRFMADTYPRSFFTLCNSIPTQASPRLVGKALVIVLGGTGTYGGAFVRSSKWGICEIIKGVEELRESAVSRV